MTDSLEADANARERISSQEAKQDSQITASEAGMQIDCSEAHQLSELCSSSATRQFASNAKLSKHPQLLKQPESIEETRPGI
jgi:hypothetical protein